jgi:hypothetical protein
MECITRTQELAEMAKARRARARARKNETRKTRGAVLVPKVAYPPVAGDSTQDWIRRYQEIDAERGALKAENERLRALLADLRRYVGETSRALAAYKRALELAPQDAKIKRNYARFAEYLFSA